MKYYEYSEDGWLVGWYNAETPRLRSTLIPPLLPASQSRWVNGAWTLDASREQQRDAEEQTERTKRQQAIAALQSYDPATATAADVRLVLAAVIYHLKKFV